MGNPAGVRRDFRKLEERRLLDHRGRATWEFIRQQHGRLWVEFLPAYAPETESGRVSVVALEEARLAQHLSPELRTVERLCPSGLAPDALAHHSGDRLLASGKAVSIVTILCNTNKSPALLR